MEPNLYANIRKIDRGRSYLFYKKLFEQVLGLGHPSQPTPSSVCAELPASSPPPFSFSMGKGKDEKAGNKYVLPLISQCPNRRYDLRCEGWSLPGVTVSADAGQH